jgi:RNA polymerase sigma factor (sigma-70 family)
VSGPVADDLRELAPQVIGALVRRYGHFDTAEDAAQEALLAAALQWPADGSPDDPRAWLIRVASRKMIDLLRSERSRREREQAEALAIPPEQFRAPAPTAQDDSLVLLFLCCHPELAPPAQVALTLRAVGGLTTTEIARAFLVPDATMGQRISRAKKQIRGSRFTLPAAADRAARLDAVLQVLYLVFTEGHTATSGEELARVELSAEAIRLTRLTRRLLPGDGEVAGLLALMLLTDARRAARTTPGGELVPMAEQDRTRWDAGMVAEGLGLVRAALSGSGLPGPYGLQAAIAALHAEAPTSDDTDWPQIVALYTLLERRTGNPMVTLNRAVAVAMVHGAAAGLAVAERVAGDDRIRTHHRLDAVRAHLREMAGDGAAAAAHYRAAAAATASGPERRYLLARAERLGSGLA